MDTTKQKIVLVTGASSGLGESISRHLSGIGYTVYGSSRTIESQQKAFRTINMDVTSGTSVSVAINSILAKHGKIDVLINNAGLGIAGPIEELSENEIFRVLDTNIIGMIRTTQAVIPAMRNQKSGLIINISSIGSELGLPYRGLYSASKAAMDRITEALRIELRPFGIQCCLIQPGGIQTNINENRLKVSLNDNNVYKNSFERTYTLINESVTKGLKAEVFGNVVESIIKSNDVKLKYRIGKPIEKLSVLLKRLLPGSTYEKMIRKHYGL